MTQASTPTPLRNDYGALCDLSPVEAALAKDLLGKAVATKKLDAAYDNTSWHKRHGKIGWLLSYDVYDITPSTILVQRRETECTKYGNSPRKSYFTIRRCGRGVIVTEMDKARVVKLAKVSTALGQVIATLTGKAKRPLKQAAPFSDQWRIQQRLGQGQAAGSH